MFSWVVEVTLPLTLSLALLLLCHSLIMRYLDAKSCYKLWAIVPLTLLLFSVSPPWQYMTSITVISNDIERFMIITQQGTQQIFNNNNLSMFWLLGCITFSTYCLFSYYFLTRKLKKCRYQPDNLLAKYSIKISTQTTLTLQRISEQYSPMLVGLINKKLIIPENFESLYNEEQQQLILEHEICHFERNDIYWNLIAMVCLALFWFHPLAWLSYFRYRRDQEISCDQHVLAQKPTDSRINYSKALLVTAETLPELAFAKLSFKNYGDQSIMFERINEIKVNKKGSKIGFTAVFISVVILLSGFSYAGYKATVPFNADSESKITAIMRVEPVYPELAAENKIEGSVVLKYDINSSGDVDNITVIKATPANVFEHAAETALKKWQYEESSNGVKNNLVQLDFALSNNKASTLKVLTERIKVIKS